MDTSVLCDIAFLTYLKPAAGEIWLHNFQRCACRQNNGSIYGTDLWNTSNIWFWRRQCSWFIQRSKTSLASSLHSWQTILTAHRRWRFGPKGRWAGLILGASVFFQTGGWRLNRISTNTDSITITLSHSVTWKVSWRKMINMPDL